MTDLKNADIGSVGKKGSITKNGNCYTVTASGRDVWDNEDGAHFAYCELEGDFDIAVRMESLTMANLYTKAGIMARETLEADSRNIFLVAFGDNGPRRNNDGGCEFQYRDEEGGVSTAIYPKKTGASEPSYPAKYPNIWLRLNRTVATFTAYFSNNGSEWLEYGKHALTINAKLLVGICVTSHNDEQTCECRFSDFRLIKRID
jgi:Uncharacterized conserved protein